MTAGHRAAPVMGLRPTSQRGHVDTIASWVDLAITTTASVSGEGFSSRCGTCGGTHTSPGDVSSRTSDPLSGSRKTNTGLPDTT